MSKITKTSIFFIISLLVITSINSWAQVDITIRREKKEMTYLQYEPVKLSITLRNNSGHTLKFGGIDNKHGTIMLDLRRHHQYTVLPRTPRVRFDANGKKTVIKLKNLSDDLILAPNERKTLIFDLAKYFPIQKAAPYMLRVKVRHNSFSADYQTKAPLHFRVQQGIQIWSKIIGVPLKENSGKIATRKVSILSCSGKSKRFFYLQIEDDKLIYLCKSIGAKIGSEKPSCDIDSLSNVHILIQEQSRLYTYLVYNYNGKLRQKKYYIASNDTIPRLVRDPELGKVMVAGGKEAKQNSDIFTSLPKDKYRDAGVPTYMTSEEDSNNKNPKKPRTNKVKNKANPLKYLWPGNWF